jgi:hypothetical protein
MEDNIIIDKPKIIDIDLKEDIYLNTPIFSNNELLTGFIVIKQPTQKDIYNNVKP